MTTVQLSVCFNDAKHWCFLVQVPNAMLMKSIPGSTITILWVLNSDWTLNQCSRWLPILPQSIFIFVVIVITLGWWCLTTVTPSFISIFIAFNTNIFHNGFALGLLHETTGQLIKVKTASIAILISLYQLITVFGELVIEAFMLHRG